MFKTVTVNLSYLVRIDSHTELYRPFLNIKVIHRIVKHDHVSFLSNSINFGIIFYTEVSLQSF
jgi:hypothetical protein